VGGRVVLLASAPGDRLDHVQVASVGAPVVARGLTGVVLVILRCAPWPRRGDRRDVARVHLAAPVAPTSCGICSPRWRGRKQPSSGNPGAHHRRCARAPPRSQREFQRVISALAGKLPQGWRAPREARCDLLALPHFRRGALAYQPFEERLHQEIRRRTDVVGIFPDRAVSIRHRLAAAASSTEEWADERRSMSARGHRQGPTGKVPRRRPRHGRRPSGVADGVGLRVDHAVVTTPRLRT